MRKGENIFKRKDGRWEARYIKGYELSGKIKYGFCYGKTYKEAKEKATKHKAALLAGKPTPQTGTHHRFGFYCDEWLRLRKNKIRESTYIKYDTVIEKHIKPKLGGCYPQGITGGIAEEFSAELIEDGLAVKTVHDILTVLHSVLKYTAAQLPGGFSCGGDHLSKGNPPGNEGAESAGAGKACQLPAEQHGRLQIRRIAYAADGYAYRGAVCA